MNSAEIIAHYELLPHPEGGFYRETYRSSILQANRCASTAILFLITSKSISHFHRLTSDEGWHFHLGSALRILEITPEGELIETILGANFKAGEKLQHYIPAGHWFASTSVGDFSFVGCTVAPGFEFEDFEMGKKQALKELYPLHNEIIDKFCLD